MVMCGVRVITEAIAAYHIFPLDATRARGGAPVAERENVQAVTVRAIARDSGT
jgi:hypothetical protein